MTPEERNTVIEALKLGLDSTRLSQSEPILKALAIMRRQGPCRHEWVNGGPMNNYKTFCAYCATAGN